ncbi:MAG: hypothetical protein R3F04_15920 [Lysobacteraceae bacterium]
MPIQRITDIAVTGARHSWQGNVATIEVDISNLGPSNSLGFSAYINLPIGMNITGFSCRRGNLPCDDRHDLLAPVVVNITHGNGMLPNRTPYTAIITATWPGSNAPGSLDATLAPDATAVTPTASLSSTNTRLVRRVRAAATSSATVSNDDDDHEEIRDDLSSTPFRPARAARGTGLSSRQQRGTGCLEIWAARDGIFVRGTHTSAHHCARPGAGLPAVDPAARISGPFDGPEGTLYYLDRDSHISYFHPEGATAYFGDLADDGGVRFRYGLNISGQYVFSADGQVQQVRVLPDDVYRWPHAEAIAQVLIQHVQQILQGQSTLQTVDWAAASAASRAMHDTNMAILDGMRADACTEHYDGVYYLGCW